MASLLDIAPSTTVVNVRGTAVDVTGVSAIGLAALLRRFPALLHAIQGRAVLSVESLYDLGPEIVAAVIAAGTGRPGNEQAEAVAASLGVSVQLELLSAILAETLPDGVEGFTKRLEALATAAGAEAVVTKAAG